MPDSDSYIARYSSSRPKAGLKEISVMVLNVGDLLFSLRFMLEV